MSRTSTALNSPQLRVIAAEIEAATVEGAVGARAEAADGTGVVVMAAAAAVTVAMEDTAATGAAEGTRLWQELARGCEKSRSLFAFAGIHEIRAADESA